jgi:hypothetical protein
MPRYDEKTVATAVSSAVRSQRWQLPTQGGAADGWPLPPFLPRFRESTRF